MRSQLNTYNKFMKDDHYQLDEGRGRRKSNIVKQVKKLEFIISTRAG